MAAAGDRPPAGRTTGSPAIATPELLDPFTDDCRQLPVERARAMVPTWLPFTGIQACALLSMDV